MIVAMAVASERTHRILFRLPLGFHEWQKARSIAAYCGISGADPAPGSLAIHLAKPLLIPGFTRKHRRPAVANGKEGVVGSSLVPGFKKGRICRDKVNSTLFDPPEV